jgi:hypothetical protein
MTDNYKENDDRRQKLIVAQTCLERAIETLEILSAGTAGNVADVFPIADVYYNYVFDKADNKHGLNDSSSNIVSNSHLSPTPQPTVNQEKWLDNIAKKYGYSKKDVWENYKKYPSTAEEAVECVKILKGKGK